MVRGYTIAGKFVPAWQLSFGTLSLVTAYAVYATAGSKKTAVTTPPINASSPEEEKFVLDFLKNNLEETEKKAH